MNSSHWLVSLCFGGLFITGCLQLGLPEPQMGAVEGRVVTSTAQPISGLTLTLTPESGAAQVVDTGADGTFRVAGLRPGIWVATATRSGSLPLEKTFSVVSGQTRALGDLTLYASQADDSAGTVTGVVHVMASGVTPLGATVEALLEPDLRLVGTTSVGESGLFALRLPPASYTLRATHPSFVTASTPGVSVAATAQVTLPDDALVFALNPGRVLGLVRRELDGADDGGVPAAGVVVSSETGATTVTASDGTFTLGGLPAGARVLHLALPDHHQQVQRLEAQVIAGADVTLDPQRLLLDRGGVEGEVQMGDNSPLRDTAVFIDGTAYSAAVSASATEPSKGSFRITGVPVGNYTLRAERTGYRTVSSSVFHIANAAQTVLSPPLAQLTAVQGAFAIDDGDATNTPGFTAAREVLLTLNDTTNVAGWRAAESSAALAGSPYEPFGADGGTGLAFQLSAGDGVKTIHLQVRDALGVEGAEVSASVVLDTTPPGAPTLRLGDGSGFIAQTDPLPFSLNGSDPGAPGAASGIAYMRVGPSVTGGQVDAPRRAYQRDDVFTRGSSAQGPVVVFAQLIDNAGNTSAPTSSTVVVDSLPPAGTSVIISDGAAATKAGYTNEVRVFLQVSATPEPNDGGLQVRLANSAGALATATPQPVTPTATLATFLDPVEGVKQVHYSFIDSAGNQSAPQVATITLDTTPPAPLAPATALLTLTSPSVTNSRAGSWTATVNDERELSPTQAVQVEIDGALQPATPPTSPSTVTGSLAFTLPNTDGLHTVRASFKDAAGNTAASAVSTLTLDRVAPSGSFSVVGTTADGLALQVFPSTSGAVVGSRVVQLNVSPGDATGVYFTPGALVSCGAVSAAAFVAPGAATLSTFDLGTNNGTVTINGCLRDLAGNTAALAPVTVRVDTTPPTGCQLVLSNDGVNGVTPPPNFTAVTTTAVTFTGCGEAPADVALVESAGAVACTGAALSWVPLTSALRVTLGADRLYTWQACVRDAAHNAASAAPANITLDTTPPSGVSVRINSGAAYVNAAQTSGGNTTLTVDGAAQGASAWAVASTPAPSSFSAFSGSTTLSTPAIDGSTLTVYARFRDAVGNLSEAQASVSVDTSLPAPPSINVLQTGTAANFINNPSARVRLNAPGNQVRLAEGADLASCTTNLASSVLQAPPDPALPFTVQVVGDGAHTLCARSRDAAGNESTVAAQTVTLDTVAPATPQMLTPSAAFMPSNTALNSVPLTLKIANAPDAAHAQWFYRVSGQTARNPVTPGAPVSGALPLLVYGTSDCPYSPRAESGIVNEFLVTETDLAGNESQPARVTLTLDCQPPAPPDLNVARVRNGRTTGRVQWGKSTSPDVVSYRLHYGTSPGEAGAAWSFTGAYAGAGPSPVTVPAIAGSATTQEASLTGLPPGAITYVTVSAVDHAGNETLIGAGDGGTTWEVALYPNEVPVDPFDGVQLLPAAGGSLGEVKLEASDDVLWAIGKLGSSPDQLYLEARDTRPSWNQPPSAWYGSGAYSETAAVASSLITRLDFPWLFTASNSQLRVWNLSTGVPTLKANVTVPNPVTSMEVRGNNLFVTTRNGNGLLYHYDLTSLYDNLSGGAPVLDETIAAATVATQATQLVWSRDRLMLNMGSGHQVAFDLTLALDGNTSTDLTTTDRFVNQVGFTADTSFQPIVSGDLALMSVSREASAVKLPAFWSKAGSFFEEAGRSTFAASGQAQLVADQYVTGVASFNSPQPRLQVGSFANVTAPAQQCNVEAPATGVGSSLVMAGAVAGNYAYTASANGRLNVWQLADGNTVSPRYSAAFRTGAPVVMPGFVTGPTGVVYDFLGGPDPVRRQTPDFINDCSLDSIVVDDTMIAARDTSLRITRLDTAFNRTLAPANDTSSSSTSFFPSTAGRLTSISRAGNYAVVAAVRNTSPVSLWLEVYRLSGVRSRATNAARTLAAADKVGEFQLDTTSGSASSVNLRVKMTNHIATVMRTTATASPDAVAWLVDLGPLIDDDPTTTMSANNVAGRFVPPLGTPFATIFKALDGKLSNRWLYLGIQDADHPNYSGLWIIDAAEAYDGNPATKADLNDALGLPSVTIANPSGLDVSGNTLVMIGTRAGQPLIMSFDVSSSEEPQLMSQAPLPLPGYQPTSCNGATYEGVAIAGSRAYVGTAANFAVFDLE